MNDYKFGNFLCMLREKSGMTQAELANQLGVTAAAVSKWENGSSKPRVELLFQLAQLFGVRAEELMSGQYIAEETLDPEAVKQINERYSYLTRVDTYNSASVKWRRLAAWAIDWNLIGFTVIFLSTLVSSILYELLGATPTTVVLIMMFVLLLYPICFILRDFIFGGRSLGKRILKLVVLDRQTGKQASVGKCALRNLFLFIVHIDVIVLLASGLTVGDRVAHTAVVLKKSLDHDGSLPQVSEINRYTAPKKHSPKKILLTAAGIVVLIAVIFFTVISLALTAAKNTEEYKLAYEYFTESESFEEMGGSETEIVFHQYSLTSKGSSDKTVKIGFLFKGKAFQVICHNQGTEWVVCEQCTKFR